MNQSTPESPGQRQTTGSVSLWWSRLVRIFIWVGVALSFFAVLELLRAYLTLYEIHPILGYGFAVVMFAGVVFGAIFAYRHFYRYPVVLRPPVIAKDQAISLEDARAYALYLCRYLNRLSQNDYLDADQKQDVKRAIHTLSRVRKKATRSHQLIEAIDSVEENTIEPQLKILREKARKEVRGCVRDIMIGVTVSRYRSADLIIVIYRNFAMVGRIIRYYNNRPRFAEQMLIMGDILRVVATVNFLNLGEKLLERLFAKVPVVGSIIDDIGQGLGAGILTSAMGHAAIDRCAAFRGWNKPEAVRSLDSQLKDFVTDVKQIFKDDVFDRFKAIHRRDAPEEEGERSRFWDSIKSGLDSALDGTERVFDGVVRRPVVAGGRGVASVGGSLWSTTKSSYKGSKAGLQSLGRAIKSRIPGKKSTRIEAKESQLEDYNEKDSH